MFSIVIPLYNKERWVERTIRSILSQSCPAAEIVIVDDGSTDRGVEIVKAIADPRIRIVTTAAPRSGPSAARNTGVRAATQEWIAFLDADDEWETDYLKVASEYISRMSDDHICLFSSWKMKYDERDAEIYQFGKRYTTSLDLDFSGFIDLWVESKMSPMWTSAVIVKREAFLAIGGFPEEYRRGEDKVAWFRILRNGRAIYNPAALAIYHQDVTGQLTQSYSNTRHPMVGEIERALPAYPLRDQNALKALSNLQIIRYAKDVGMRERLAGALVRGFYFRQDPGWFFTVHALNLIPGAIQRTIRGLQKSRN